MSPSWTVANCAGTTLNLRASTYSGKHMKKIWAANQEQLKKQQLTVSIPARRVSVDWNSNDGHPPRPMRRRKCVSFTTNIMRSMRGRIRNSSKSNESLVQDLRPKLWRLRCRIGGEEDPVFLAPKLHWRGAGKWEIWDKCPLSTRKTDGVFRRLQPIGWDCEGPDLTYRWLHSLLSKPLGRV